MEEREQQSHYEKIHVCECKHFKDEHGGWGSVRDCRICECQHYKRDKNFEGLYIYTTPLDSDFIIQTLFGDYYLKQVTSYQKENDIILKKYENMPEL